MKWIRLDNRLVTHMGTDSSKKANPGIPAHADPNQSDPNMSDLEAEKIPPVPKSPPPAPPSDCPLGIPISASDKVPEGVESNVPTPWVPPTYHKVTTFVNGIPSIKWEVEPDVISAAEEIIAKKAADEKEKAEKAAAEKAILDSIAASFTPVVVTTPDSNIVADIPDENMMTKFNEQAAEQKKIEDKKKEEEKERLERMAKYPPYSGYGYGGYNMYPYNRFHHDSPTRPTNRTRTVYHGSDEEESDEEDNRHTPTPEQVLRIMAANVKALRADNLRMGTSIIELLREVKALKEELATFTPIKTLTAQMNIKLNRIQAVVIPTTQSSFKPAVPPTINPRLSADAICKELAIV